MLLCSDAIKCMHDYLDGDLPDEQHAQLTIHMSDCKVCRERYTQLHKTIAVIQYVPEEEVSNEFCQKIMRALPKVRLIKRFFSFLRRYPVRSFASICGLVMLGGLIYMWDTDRNLVVKIPNEDRVTINGNHVDIPDETIIHGDVFVKNGTLAVAGVIEGDLIVMDAEYQLRPGAVVEGEIREIDTLFERVSIKLKSWFD